MIVRSSLLIGQSLRKEYVNITDLLGNSIRNGMTGETKLASLSASLKPVHQSGWEDLKGEPFVGAAGEILDEMLSKIGLSRDRGYIGNVLKCRPPENRDPTASEIKACVPYLDRQIRIIKPKIIVTLGRHSTSYILSKCGLEAGGITKLHGRRYEVELLGFRVLVIPMYHPAAVLYNPKYRKDLEGDFQLLGRELERLGSV